MCQCPVCPSSVGLVCHMTVTVLVLSDSHHVWLVTVSDVHARRMSFGFINDVVRVFD